MADTLESDPRPLGLARVLSIQAHANRLANRRLQSSLAGLSTSDLHARRISFFPTLIGTLNHLIMEQFKGAAGFEMVTAHYRGIGPAFQDILGGQVEEAIWDALKVLTNLHEYEELRKRVAHEKAGTRPVVKTYKKKDVSPDWWRDQD